MRSAIALFAILMSVWLLNSGHYTTLITGFGVASCLLVVALSWRMGVVDDEGVPVHLIPRAILYIPWIAKEVFLANVDVARRILSFGRPKISPAIRIKTRAVRTHRRTSTTIRRRPTITI